MLPYMLLKEDYQIYIRPMLTKERQSNNTCTTQNRFKANSIKGDMEGPFILVWMIRTALSYLEQITLILPLIPYIWLARRLVSSLGELGTLLTFSQKCWETEQPMEDVHPTLLQSKESLPSVSSFCSYHSLLCNKHRPSLSSQYCWTLGKVSFL